jgi:hypothetical protein
MPLAASWIYFALHRLLHRHGLGPGRTYFRASSRHNMSIVKKCDVCLPSGRPITRSHTSRDEEVLMAPGDVLTAHPDHRR